MVVLINVVHVKVLTIFLVVEVVLLLISVLVIAKLLMANVLLSIAMIVLTTVNHVGLTNHSATVVILATYLKRMLASALKSHQVILVVILVVVLLKNANKQTIM